MRYHPDPNDDASGVIFGDHDCADDDCPSDHIHVYTDGQQRARDEHLILTTIECVHDVGLHEFYDLSFIIDAAAHP